MQIEWLDSAIMDLQRLRDFILPHNLDAARRAVKTIKHAISPLESYSHIGKPVEDLPNYHDIFIPFGASGYVLRYRVNGDVIYIIAVKHCKEAGFSGEAPSLWLVKEPLETVYGQKNNRSSN